MALVAKSTPFQTGPISAQMLDELQNYVVCEPMPFVVDLEKSHGMTLATIDGQELFDWTGYYGSKLLGHNHPRLQETEYVRQLVLAANNKTANPDFLTADCLNFYRKIHEIAPDKMRNPKLEVYTVNSGAEAVENMMKYLVSRHNTKRKQAGKDVSNKRFIYFDKAFHGRTVYALGVTQTMDPVATKDFHGLTIGGNIKLPFPSFDNDRSESENLKDVQNILEMAEMALSQMADELVGIIVEPIQGAGGHRCAMPQFFRGLSELCHKYDVALAFDEVQTGLGATGSMFAIDQFDLPHPPIAVATGKKFGCGIVYMLEPLEDIGVLDSTWGGTLADMVRVLQELKIVEDEDLITAAATNGRYLHQALRDLQKQHQGLMLNVRGMGLYQGFSLSSPDRKAEFIKHAREHHSLLLLGAGHSSIRLRPNLNMTIADVDRLIQILDICFRELEVNARNKEPKASI